MNHTVENTFNSNYDFQNVVPKTNEVKKSSSFYDDYLKRLNENKQETESAIKKFPFKLSDLMTQQIQTVSQTPETTGSAIKKNIKNVLSTKYGELDSRNLFDDIDDKDVEDNIQTAENTIKTNVDRGVLSKSTLPKLPNLRDGLALSYAAANKGKSKAATRAREAAYTELNPKNFYNDYLKNNSSQDKNKSWNKISKVFDLPKVNKNPRYVSADVLNMRSAPGTDSKVIGKLTDGTEVNYTGNKTKEIDGHLWAEVTYDGKTGWVAADYLKTAKPQDFSSGAIQNNSATTSIAYQKPNTSINVKYGDSKDKIETKEYNNEYGISPLDGEAVRKAFSNVGDFDKSGEMHCVDLTKWFINSFTTLKHSNGNGCDQVDNTAKSNNITNEITTTPCAPSIYSVKAGTYGPGIKDGGRSDATAGHTGVVIDCKYLGDGKYELTYIDTYLGYDDDGLKATFKKKTFDKSDNVTYLNLSNYLK